jgi:hypothetical protein
MKLVRRLLPYVFAFLVLAGAWVWWNRPQVADMAAYVPADSLVYLEANNLPDIASALTQTDAWQALADPAGIKSGIGQVGWLSRIASWTGIGPAEAVVFSRAQVAATVMGLEAADGGDTLRIKPRMALVIETHTGARRTRSAIEKRVGDFANRAYDNPRIEEKDTNEAHWIIWSAATSDRRIIAAMTESMVVLGNDEAAVRACLAVRRGERPSLMGNIEMEEMRRRLSDSNRLAFGFVSPQGAAKIFEVLAAIYVGQVSQDQQTQSLAANILPQMANKILGSVGWSTRVAGGAVEDRYFMSVKNDATKRLRDTLSAASVSTLRAGEMLPADTYSLTRYTTRDSLSAWRGLNFSISSQLDPILAVMVTPLLKAALKPYGIEEPESFMQAIGPEMTTARLNDRGEGTVIIVEALDEKTLRDFVLKRLGTSNPQTERIGDMELLSSTDESRGAAGFVAGHLLLGPKDNLRRCLTARHEGKTLGGGQDFRQALQRANAIGPTQVITLTDDFAASLSFISFISNQRGVRARAANEQELSQALGQLPFAVTETQMIEGGIERTTRSSFGQLGVLATQFATK